MTIAILVAGTVLVVSVADRPERDRLAAMEGIEVGQPAIRVADRLGARPHRCPGDRVEHLRESFPEGWTPAGIDLALERLAEVTASRWVFNVGDAPPVLCGGTERQTEVGVNAAGEIVWFVPVLGSTPLRLPPWLAPAGSNEPASPAPDVR